MFRIPECPSDLHITRITCVDVTGRSPKMIGKNARLDDHGNTATERLVRVFTNSGHAGFGVTRVSVESIAREEVPRALHANPASLVDPEHGITLRGLEHALWDLLGHVTGQPVYALLGESRRERVEAYDGALYFCDLVYPEHALARVEHETAESVAQGHRAIKMKIGRGNRWMPAEEGYQRDVDAIRAVRRVVGPEFIIMVDGNNGFTEAGAERLFADIGDQHIFWAEELFPETVEDYTRFRSFLEARGLHTLIADGETLPEPSLLLPFIEQRLVDVVQLDMNQIGLSAWWLLAAFAQRHGATCAPHTWASMFGLYASLHLGKAIPNFLSAEVPAYVPDAYHPDGFTFRDGAYTLSDLPGWGLTLDARVYEEKYAGQEQRWA